MNTANGIKNFVNEIESKDTGTQQTKAQKIQELSGLLDELYLSFRTF